MYFSIKDVVAKKFGPLMSQVNADTMKRECTILFTTGQKCPFTDFPSHYELYQIGDFDDKRGIFQPMQPVLICNLLDCKETALAEIQRNQVALQDSGINAGDSIFTPSPSGDEEVTNV